MKWIAKVLSVILLLGLLYSCTITDLDKNRDWRGHIQFIADFNTRMFADEYDPASKKLEKGFKYGRFETEFQAEYKKDSIAYTVKNPSEDKIEEMKIFDEIYNEYYESWNNYVTKTNVGSLDVTDVDEVKYIDLIISGYIYEVRFFPLGDKPNIVFSINEAL